MATRCVCAKKNLKTREFAPFYNGLPTKPTRSAGDLCPTIGPSFLSFDNRRIRSSCHRPVQIVQSIYAQNNHQQERLTRKDLGYSTHDPAKRQNHGIGRQVTCTANSERDHECTTKTTTDATALHRDQNNHHCLFQHVSLDPPFRPLLHHQ